MTTITITIQRSSVLADAKVVSHAEVATIEDDKMRYLYEAGTEKAQQLHQCITDAFSDASSVMRQFATGTPAQSVTANDTFASSGDLVIAMSVTTRKAAGLETPLTAALHKYIVDDTLARFYKGVNNPSLQGAHEKAMPADISAIEGLVYRRMKPTYALNGLGTI